MVVSRLAGVVASGDVVEAAPDPAEDDQIGQRDQQQEDGGDGGANDAADFLERKKAVLHRRGGGGDGEGSQDHDGGMAEGEEEPGVDRAFAVLHQLADDVVDGGDVIGVYRVAQAEDPGQEGGAQQRGSASEGVPGPGPGDQVGDDQQRGKAGGAGPYGGEAAAVPPCLRDARHVGAFVAVG